MGRARGLVWSIGLAAGLGACAGVEDADVEPDAGVAATDAAPLADRLLDLPVRFFDAALGPPVGDAAGPGSDADADAAEPDAGAVVQPCSPPPESRCDGLDDDCDGLVDEDCACRDGETQACGSAVGACRPGRQACASGGWGACEGALGPRPETCDGQDEDCNGQVDDGLAEGPLCGLQAGVCAGARQRCGGVEGWLLCDDQRLNRHDMRYTPAEGADHCDGVDNDCDGQIDEGCDCGPGQTRACGSGVGECRSGTERCVAGRWADCDARGPSPEQCNGLDDDCDGRVDDDAPCPADHACRGGICARERWLFEAEGGAMGHGTGRREREGWCAGTAEHRPGYLLYGPYTRDVPAGTYDAVYRVLVDNVNADDNVVARLEINDFDRRPDCGDCVIARRDVRRRELRAPMAWQDVALRFQNPGGHRLEMRLYWTDIAYLCVDHVVVQPVP